VNINEITQLIEKFAKEKGKTPTISEFAEANNLHAAAIIRKFGSWNDLIVKAGLKPNKSAKRSKEQLLMWLKSHPNARYSEIPYGIRSGLIDKFGSIGKARIAAGLSVTDWRSFAKRGARKKSENSGRPIEYTKETIILGLQNLAKKLGRPPKMKEITKENCGFPFTAIISRFKSFNEALKAAHLPPSYSYQEYNKLNKDLHTVMINIKINMMDLPLYYNIEVGGMKPTFIYEDRYEEVYLTRSNIYDNANKILKNNKRTIVWYLVDDSLYDNEKFEIRNIMELDGINERLKELLVTLRLRYDEINRKYIAPLFFMKEGDNLGDK